MRRRWVRLISVGMLAGLVAVAASNGWLNGLGRSWFTTVANPGYALCLVVVGLVELIVPADPELRRRHVGIAQDCVWFVMSALLIVTIVRGWLAVIDLAITPITHVFRFDAAAAVGAGGAATIAFVIGDLCAWWSHWIHHHSRTLWPFHTVHHSQTTLNVLSDNRQHIIETMLTATLTFIPARLLGLDTAESALLALASLAFAAFIHANIRTDLGPLGFVFISPQAHRLHHSADPSHYNTNYGSVFAWWDHLFGTRHRDRHSYPATGINDAAFPMEEGAHPLLLTRTWWAQTRYPFSEVARLRNAAARGSLRSGPARAISSRSAPTVRASSNTAARVAHRDGRSRES